MRRRRNFLTAILIFIVIALFANDKKSDKLLACAESLENPQVHIRFVCLESKEPFIIVNNKTSDEITLSLKNSTSQIPIVNNNVELTVPAQGKVHHELNNNDSEGITVEMPK